MAISSERHKALREMLETRRREVETYVPLTQGCYDELDRELEDAREDTLERIARALEELERGSYGICLGCLEEIREERLRALPFVQICDECDAKAEHAAHQAEVARRVRERFSGTLFGI